MFSHYHMTILEEFLETTYATAGVIYPHQITVQELAWRLKVWLHYEPVSSRALEATSGMYSMFIDSRLTPNQQRIDFFHELCHLLRHVGNQMTMPQEFTKMQEIEAEHFVLYAVMPFSMISRIGLPDQRTFAINTLMEIFNVPIDLAEKRLDQIQRRCLQGVFNDVFGKEEEYIQPSWSAETQRILNQLDRQLVAKGHAKL